MSLDLANATFMGYVRENGRVGVRNHVLILSVDDISNAACEAVANNVKGTLAIPHAYGRLQFGEDLDLHFRTIIGTCANPNVAACVVIGIDSREEHGDWFVYQYTGDPDKTTAAERRTLDWVREVQGLGAGEIVLNCMNQDGVRRGYDIEQLAAVRVDASIAPTVGTVDEEERLRGAFGRFVASVEAHEIMKLRCLNGTHSTLAYLGYLAGHETIADAVADRRLVAAGRRLSFNRGSELGDDAPRGVELGAPVGLGLALAGIGRRAACRL